MMFQFYRNAPSETLLDKMNRQKLKYKTYQLLIENALESVEKIFNGSLPPLNSAFKLCDQIYYHQYLLFYFADSEGSGLLSSKYVNKDIYNLSLLESLEFDNICLTNMIIINYRGFKIVVKAVPNTLINEDIHFETIQQYFYSNRLQENDDQFGVSIKKISKQLGIENENIYVDKQTFISSIVTHPEIKGFPFK